MEEFWQCVAMNDNVPARHETTCCFHVKSHISRKDNLCTIAPVISDDSKSEYEAV